jgi:hypothetical protein
MGERSEQWACGNAAPGTIQVTCVAAPALLGHKSVAGTLRVTDAGVEFVPNKTLSPVRHPGRA